MLPFGRSPLGDGRGLQRVAFVMAVIPYGMQLFVLFLATHSKLCILFSQAVCLFFGLQLRVLEVFYNFLALFLRFVFVMLPHLGKILVNRLILLFSPFFTLD